jgi:putative redox protein
MTIGMYARRKQWPLASVVVRLRHSRIHATDCSDCDTKDEMLDRIDRDIELTGNLTPEQREKLLEIADKCPVHRTLTRGMKIHSRLV